MIVDLKDVSSFPAEGPPASPEQIMEKVILLSQVADELGGSPEVPATLGRDLTEVLKQGNDPQDEAENYARALTDKVGDVAKSCPVKAAELEPLAEARRLLLGAIRNLDWLLKGAKNLEAGVATTFRARKGRIDEALQQLLRGGRLQDQQALLEDVVELITVLEGQSARRSDALSASKQRKEAAAQKEDQQQGELRLLEVMQAIREHRTVSKAEMDEAVALFGRLLDSDHAQDRRGADR